jgi:predicted transcriptional regulator
MAKFLTVLLLLVGAFGAGYYVGQRPVGTLQQSVSDLQHSLKEVSKNVMDTTLGIERDLRRRQGLVEAKSRFIQAKVHVIDQKHSEAAKELAAVISAIEAATKGAKADDTTAALHHLIDSLRDIQLELTTGKQVSFKKLDELQQGMDQQLNK